MDILESMGLVELIKFVQNSHHSMELNVSAISDIPKLMGFVKLSHVVQSSHPSTVSNVFVMLDTLNLMEIVLKFHAQLMNVFLMEFVSVFQDFSEILKDYVKKAVMQMNFSLIINVIALKTMSEILMESVFISLHNNAQPFQAGMELTVFAKLDTSSRTVFVFNAALIHIIQDQTVFVTLVSSETATFVTNATQVVALVSIASPMDVQHALMLHTL